MEATLNWFFSSITYGKNSHGRYVMGEVIDNEGYHDRLAAGKGEYAINKLLDFFLFKH